MSGSAVETSNLASLRALIIAVTKKFCVSLINKTLRSIKIL